MNRMRARSKRVRSKVAYGIQARTLASRQHRYGMPTTFDLMPGAKRSRQLPRSSGRPQHREHRRHKRDAAEKELLTPEELAAGVATFEGVKRRMELSPRFDRYRYRRLWLELRKGSERHRRHAAALPRPASGGGI